MATLVHPEVHVSLVQLVSQIMEVTQVVARVEQELTVVQQELLVLLVQQDTTQM